MKIDDEIDSVKNLKDKIIEKVNFYESNMHSLSDEEFKKLDNEIRRCYLKMCNDLLKIFLYKHSVIASLTNSQFGIDKLLKKAEPLIKDIKNKTKGTNYYEIDELKMSLLNIHDFTLKNDINLRNRVNYVYDFFIKLL